MQENCGHIYRLSATSREKKCLKCEFITKDFGIVRKYPVKTKTWKQK